MGKKKPQKTKELSVAIAEASSTGGEETVQGQQQNQPQAPRKRGRPRKIIANVVETVKKEEKKAQTIEQPQEGLESSMKKGKLASVGEQQEGSSSSATCTRVITKEEGVSEEIHLPKGEPSKRSRARRKSKPRKST